MQKRDDDRSVVEVALAFDRPWQHWQHQRNPLESEPLSDLLSSLTITFSPADDWAIGYLVKDRDALLAFYDFPAKHWRHLRTTNPIESTLATIRLRHRRTKGRGSRTASLTMMFKLAESAGKRWRLLGGSLLLPDVLQGIPFPDGLRFDQAAA